MKILGKGRYLRLVDDAGWEYVDRINSSGVVAVIAVTQAKELILTEQFRPAVKRRVIDLPAGLAGDLANHRREALGVAAKRELLEETGFRASRLTRVLTGPPSAGMSSELVTFFLARNVTRIADGGGDQHEDIEVHVVPIDSAADWLRKRGRGRWIDPKVYAALYFATQR